MVIAPNHTLDFSWSESPRTLFQLDTLYAVPLIWCVIEIIFPQMIPDVKADEPCITKEGYQLVAELIQHLDEVEAESAKRWE